jgi:general secretion pathway protein G
MLADDSLHLKGGGWALRSYASPPDEPQEGEDIFDIHSRSTRVGLNGIAYQKW